MPLKVKPMRYAHPEGHTDVCYYNGEKGGLITCGADGDVRFWLDLMDDDPSAMCVAEQATACVSKKGKIYVGNDNNTVQVLTYPELEREGIVTRFSATISALATVKNSNLIVSGACDMRIQVTNIDTSDSIELNGHEAPILGLSLDPKEEYVASSSADGTIKVWDIKEKKSIHTWNNIVPKCNSFFTAKSYCTPSFNCKDGSYLAYPHGKDIVLIERGTWKEIGKLKCSNLKADLHICKSSECGMKLAACSVLGEIVVWNVDKRELIGYVEHQQNAKITSIVWHLNKTNELAFCDSLGQLGCVDVITNDDKSLDDLNFNSITNGHNNDENYLQDNYINDNDDDGDDDGDNIISLNKIKSSIDIDDDKKSIVSSISDCTGGNIKNLLPEINLQSSFQPGSTPIHLLSRFMVWNDIGIVKCYTNEDSDESTIEVEFHDTSIHHSMHMVNYLRHTLAALSSQALALSCQSNDGNPSKLVVIALQGWGNGNKEWSIELPEDEQSQCIAAGNNFIALGTSRRNIRLFMIGGVQREIIAVPGPIVSMNALDSHLIVAYHTGIGASKDQHMNLMWIQIRGENLKSRTITLPLSPSSELIWLGLTDNGSPIIMDTEGVIKIFHKKSNLWRVAADTDKQCKGKIDHYFIIGVSEKEKCVRCILCKGSHYPATSPRPNVIEIPLIVPLCEIESDKTQKEAPLWQIGSVPSDEAVALFALIGYACKMNAEYRVVDLCQYIAPQSIIEMAITYAGKSGRMALANKLQNIAEEKNRKRDEVADEDDDIFAGMDADESGIKETQDEEIILTPSGKQKSEIIEIRPLTLSLKKRNPFLKKATTSTTKGLDGLNSLPEKPQKPKTPNLSSLKTQLQQQKISPMNKVKKETFVTWFEKNKEDLQNEFPEMSPSDLTKVALPRYKEESQELLKSQNTENKKRKLISPESENSQSKRPPSKLLHYLCDK
ncbi:hypothetical protein PV325_002159 [Microctonus aethiopoides]|uniref:WD repeat-containing protein 55 homolog n=1 Tax=Microctonus aethiopoides TaxID=144406 RepID=A0AA39FQS2_9HYME|nr:hypothetical protein PV325_002159 [Microctonus aethiopoides]KAK0174105.1 hypothetical protein PV328_007218 [Microctonus aethiopoides]